MKRFSSAIVLLTLVICFGYTVQNRWNGSQGGAWKSIISSDGYGYYAYLPCIFIYHQFNFQKTLEEERKFSPVVNSFTARLSTNQPVDKCFIGEAILLAPFFLLAYLLSFLLGFDLGGYGCFFQISVSIAALFYLAIGLIYIRKLLKLYAISDFVSGLVLILIVFGTNVFYYATMEPSMSHIYSFGLMAFFLFHAKKSMDEFKPKNIAWMMVAITILALIRPTNLLGMLFIPFLTGSYKETVTFIVKFFKNKKLVYFLLIVAAILSVQFVTWYAETGHFFVWSYPGEGFNFLKTHFIDILFSYKKGLFVYTPLIFIIIISSLGLFLYSDRFLFFCVLSFFLLITYIFCSWSTWYYGASFGLRAFIDFYPVFALLLAIVLNSLKSLWTRIPIILILVLCIGLNLIQTYQYKNSILCVDAMEKDRYWKIFLKTDNSYVGIFDLPDTREYNYLKNYYFSNDFEHNTWGHDINISMKYAQNGTHSALVEQQHQYSPTLLLKASELPKIKPLYIYVKLWAYMPDFDNNAVIVVSVQDDKGNCFFWKTRLIQGFVFERNLWTQEFSLVGLPDFRNQSDQLKVYVLNTKGDVYIDNMEVFFGTPK